MNMHHIATDLILIQYFDSAMVAGSTNINKGINKADFWDKFFSPYYLKWSSQPKLQPMNLMFCYKKNV